jgi:hypothetical protein
MNNATLKLSDGMVLWAGDKARAQGEYPGWRLCKFLWIKKGVAFLSAPLPFGTVCRASAEIRPHIQSVKS